MLEPRIKRKIFVYGSLRTGFFNYDKYLKGKVIKSELGRVKGKLYHMPHKGYPALIEGDDWIYGEVMTILDYENVINSMDLMEGYLGLNNKDNEYNRIEMEVDMIGKKSTEKCYVYYYAMNDKETFEKNSVLIEDGNWRSFMLQEVS
ncbi:gamma-glutamylcyclotransferase family protein [Clostridium sp. B9]|uniref:gamma-glutamylcyclotransferase family protein n=1 Tax=Clostridium sp. B9 TaxID=3423224 RepID=UPI003D2F388D